MGSSRSEYNRHRVDWTDLEIPTKEMAWKKIGFENVAALKQRVRELPPERRLELLTEYFINEISKAYLRDRIHFMESIGQTTTVSREEILEYAARVYPSFEVDTTWIEKRYAIDPEDLSLIARRKEP